MGQCSVLDTADEQGLGKKVLDVMLIREYSVNRVKKSYQGQSL